MSRSSHASDRRAVLLVCLKAGVTGVNVEAIRTTLQLTKNQCGNHLRALHEAGQVGRSSVGRGCLWGSPEIADRYAERLESRRRYRQRKQTPTDEPVRIRRKAEDAPRVTEAVIASVWDLGKE